MSSNSKDKTIFFEYHGFFKNQRVASGKILAHSKLHAKILLHQRGIRIIKLKRSLSFSSSWFSLSIKSKEITTFTRQLSTLILSGIPLLNALNLISHNIKNTKFKEVLLEIKQGIETGTEFHTLLAKYPRYFNEFYCQLILLAEKTGTLDQTLNRIAVYREKIETLKKKIKTALYYPCTVILISVCLTMVLLTKVLPIFQEMFSNLGLKLPLLTRLVLQISEFIQALGLYFIAFFLSISFLTWKIYNTGRAFKYFCDRVSLSLPILGSLFQKTAIAHFSRSLASSIQAGLPLLEGLQLASNTSGNQVYRNALQDIKNGLLTGHTLHKMMQQHPYFPNYVVQMISIGEESGNLDLMLDRIATLYEEEVMMQVDGLTKLLEPIIMILLALWVGTLVLAMYLPIFNMGSLF